MASEDDLNLTQWSAVVALLLLLLVPLAVAGAAWSRRRYVRAVTRLQSALAAGDGELQIHRPTAPPNRLALQVQRRRADEAVDPQAAAPARRLRRRVLGTQFAAGLLYWWLLLICLLAAFAMWQELSGEAGETTEDATALAAHLVLWPLLVLPAVLGWAFQAGLAERHVWLGAGIAAAGFGLGLAGLGTGVVAAVVVAAAAALLAAMLAAFLRPAVRGAGPPLVAALSVALVVFAFGVALAVAFDDTADDAPVSAEDWAWAAAYLLLVLAASAAAGWRMLLRLARRYEQRRFSDQQLALHAYWGLLTAYCGGAVLLLSFDERTGDAMQWAAAAVLLVWLAWRGLERAALALARRGAPAPCGALLLLRVFKPSARSEGFTDRFLARWRFAGPTWMIAGPDLAGGHMDPDEFFAFVRGRLHEHFIVAADDVPARVQALDDGRDPDGRCRVHELFCSNATWRAAVLALMDHAGVVLLDLREYHAGRAGTRFELEAVLQRLPLERLIVLVGEHESPAPVAAAIEEAWRLVDPRRRAEGQARLQVLSVGAGSAAEMNGLLAAAAHIARLR